MEKRCIFVVARPSARKEDKVDVSLIGYFAQLRWELSFVKEVAAKLRGLPQEVPVCAR